MPLPILTASPVIAGNTLLRTGQVERFAWYPDGESAVVIPEGENRRMGWTTLEYDASKKVQEPREQDPQVKWVCRSIQDDETFPPGCNLS
jgi:hypothetical protein